MKKIIVIISVLLLFACSEKETSKKPARHTFVVVSADHTDTVKNCTVSFGDYDGLGRAYVFYDGFPIIVAIFPQSNVKAVKAIN